MRVPTAELLLDGAEAIPVAGLTDGVKNMTPMLTITRTWNSICAVGGTRRLLELAIDFAKKRVAFGAPLSSHPLHTDTLANVASEHAAAFLLAMRCAQLLGREDAQVITEQESQLLRLLVPLAKLTTGKQAVAMGSELIEAFGGAGYVEDTGIPRYFRDAQVLPIWEGTTNVLSLDVLRVLRKGGSLEPLRSEIDRCAKNVRDASLASSIEIAKKALDHADAWIRNAVTTSPETVETGARRFALTLGRSIELALLCDHAQWALDQKRPQPLHATAAAVRRFASTPIDLILENLGDANELLRP
jgi:hypothetical protein